MRRPALRVELLVLIVAGVLVAAFNGSWWRVVTDGRSWHAVESWTFVAACFVTLVAVHFALIAPLANRWLVKPLLTIVIVSAAAASYYMRTYAIIMDPTMVENVLRTDTREARELITGSMIGWVAAESAIPVAFVWWVGILRSPWIAATGVRVASVFAALVVAFLALLAVSRDMTSLMRNQREARYLVTPANLFYGLAVNSKNEVRDVNVPREPVGRDASIFPVAHAAKPRVLVLVVGETARAANFSLLGYVRETNPKLAALRVTAFSNVTSCGTSTEISVPCMFSRLGREQYDTSRIRNSESLLDVLKHAGYAVKWIDNQSGCKGVCKGVEYIKVDPASAPDLCDGKECFDGVLARELADELGAVHRDTVFVLHMMGNHGPAYFRRYPREFREFIPDCATAQLRDCSREEVVNAYDNGILYTDHVLAAVIEELKRADARVDAAMIYVSDHGESLGEKGLYLHGVPYAIAPEQQTHVPMLIWLSSALTLTGDVSARCLRERAAGAYSHDNLFHSVLGLMNVRTSAYRAERDLFEGCRGGTYAVESGGERRTGEVARLN